MAKHFTSAKLTKIGEKVLDKYHPDKAEYARFKYVFIEKATKYAAKIGKISSIYQALGIDGDYIIIVNKQVWDELTKKQKIAVLDHEMCHAIIEVDDENDHVKFKLQHHDYEEFVEIIERHGLWNVQVKEIANACKKSKKKNKGKKK